VIVAACHDPDLRSRDLTQRLPAFLDPRSVRDAALTPRFLTRCGSHPTVSVAERSATVGGHRPEPLAPRPWARTLRSHHFGNFWLANVALDTRPYRCRGFRLQVVIRGRVLVVWVHCVCNHDSSSTISRRTEAQHRRHGQLHRSSTDLRSMRHRQRRKIPSQSSGWKMVPRSRPVTASIARRC
jgi:hypothetical protein